MKKTHLLFISIFTAVVLMSSCNNSSTNKKTDKDSEDKKEIKIEYLEDFAQFENHEQVKDYFGQGNVISTEWALDEGTEQYLVSIVHPNQKNKIIIYWKQESGVYADFSFVEAMYSLYDTNWEFVDEEGVTFPTKVGIAVGDSISKFEKLNGAPIGFYGQGWDYGGYVFDAKEKFNNYTIVLGLSDEYIATPEGTAAFMNMEGDKEFYSDDAKLSAYPLIIYSIMFNRPDNY